MSIVRRGPRGKLAADLDDLADGWDHFEDARQAEAARAAAEALRRGAKTARAGHTDYEVTDEIS